MGFLERFRIGSRQVGKDLAQLEAKKFVLEGATDVDNLTEHIGEIGGLAGLGEKTQTRAAIEGANAARGTLNERVNGFRINP